MRKDIEEGIKCYYLSYSPETPIQTLWEKIKLKCSNQQCFYQVNIKIYP